MATIIDGDFEWDEEKAASNLAKHGVSFPKPPPSLLTLPPCISTTGPGQPSGCYWNLDPERTLFIVHVERRSRDRIISARPASRAERDVYESGETS